LDNSWTDGKITLTSILRKKAVKMWTEFIWLKIRNRSCEHGNGESEMTEIISDAITALPNNPDCFLHIHKLKVLIHKKYCVWQNVTQMYNCSNLKYKVGKNHSLQRITKINSYTLPFF
jgi:hypothetical protein